MKKRSITDLLIYIVSAELIGVLSALLTGSFSYFFDKYEKPPLMPPSWLFPPVWVILYAVMGISAYMIQTSDADSDTKRHALTVYWLQLAVNFSWSIIFFRFEALWTAAAVILLLIVLIVIMIKRFRKIRPIAGNINIPYLIWVMFAAYLNIAAAIIN
jgi:tryptophan-rich sensory protein